MQVDDKKDVILPGTVVLQYVNDDETWAAIVVGDHMKCRLDNAQQEKFENRPDEYHICLILGIFLGYNKTWSIFSREDDLDYLFPNYRLERRGKATPIDLAEEIQLFKIHQAKSCFRGLQAFVNLRNAVFGFSAKRAEVLNLVGLCQHFSAGGTYENRPGWINLYEEDARKFLTELQKAIPKE